jgi:hypothetical protein
MTSEKRCGECGAILQSWGQPHDWQDCEREKAKR